MKKQILFVISLIIILLGGVSPLRAETPAKPVYYVEVYESSLMGAKSVCINYGVNAPFGKSYKITDGDGSPIDFEMRWERSITWDTKDGNWSLSMSGT